MERAANDNEEPTREEREAAEARGYVDRLQGFPYRGDQEMSGVREDYVAGWFIAYYEDDSLVGTMNEG